MNAHANVLRKNFLSCGSLLKLTSAVLWRCPCKLHRCGVIQWWAVRAFKVLSAAWKISESQTFIIFCPWLLLKYFQMVCPLPFIAFPFFQTYFSYFITFQPSFVARVKEISLEAFTISSAGPRAWNKRQSNCCVNHSDLELATPRPSSRRTEAAYSPPLIG